MYELILKKWIEGKITEEKLNLLILCGWITQEEGDEIRES